MYKYTLLFLSILVLVANLTYAQQGGPDCISALTICNGSPININPSGEGIDDFAAPFNSGGCLSDGEQNSTWFYLEFNSATPANSLFSFVITPSTPTDYDFALYGPDLTDCDNLGAPLRCSHAFNKNPTGLSAAAGDNMETTGGDGFVKAITVSAGDGFYLIVNNFEGKMIAAQITFGEAGANFLDCSASNSCDLTVGISVNGSGCQTGSPFNLNSNVTSSTFNTSFEWTGENGSAAYLSDINNPGPTVTPPANFSGTLIYRLTVTDNDENCSVTSDDLTIEIGDGPTIQIQNADDICLSDDLVTLDISPSTGSVTWGGAANSDGTVMPSTLGVGMHTVTYDYTDDSGCTSSGSEEITIIAAPEATIIGDLTYCQAEIDAGSATLEANGTGGTPGYNYSWTTPAGTLSDKIITVTDSGNYLVTVTDNKGCTDESAEVMVEITTNPEVTINDPGPVCESLTAQSISVNTSENGVGVWDTSTGIVDDMGMLNPAALGVGSYTINYAFTSDQTGCTNEQSLNIEIVAPPASNPSFNDSSCDASNIELFGDADVTNADYSWTGPDGFTSNEQNPVSTNGPGSYFLTTSINGCSSTPAELMVTVGTGPTPTATNSGPACEGTLITLLGDANITGAMVTYQWTGPNGYTSDQKEPADITVAGDYTLTVTAGGCIADPVSTTVIINSNPEPQIGGSTTFCTGTSTVLDAGTGFDAYLWSDAAATADQFLSVSTAGDYTVTVTDQNGCTGEASITISEDNSLNPVITGQPSFCEGNSTMLSAGPGFVSYNWSNGEMTETVTINTAGSYMVTVSDAGGCTGEQSIMIAENTLPTISIAGNPSFCEGSSTTLDAGDGFASYDWGSSSNRTLEVTEAGTYSVTITDTNGCTNEANISVTTNDNPEPQIGGSTTFCTGTSTVLDAGTGFDAYLWSDAAATTDQSLSVSTAGEYTVTVTNQNGCTGETSVTVSAGSSLNPVITGEPSFCEGSSTTLSAGSGFTSYNWSNGESTESVLIDIADVYTVTVSDAGGCTGESTIQVTENMTPVAELTADPVTVCNASAQGSTLDFGSLVISGDQDGIWTEQTNSGAMGIFPNLDFEGVTAGAYTFIYTTNSAVAPCVDPSYSISITVKDCGGCPGVNLNTPMPLCNVDGSLDLATLVDNGPNGTWGILTAPDGTNPAIINNNVLEAANADQGTYTLQYTVTDQVPNGCETEYTIDLEVSSAATAGSANAPLNTCSDEANVIDLFAELTDADDGGTWTILAGTATGFDADNGTFTTSDQPVDEYIFQYEINSNGACPGDAETVTVNINALPVAEAGTGTTLTCGMTDFTLMASGTTGADIAISWSGPGMITNGDTYNPTVNSAGNFILMVENMTTGCSTTDMVEIFQDSEVPTVNTVPANALSCDSLTIVLFSNTSTTTPVNYSWTGPDGFTSIEQYPSVNMEGEYFVTVFDPIKNCTSSPASVIVINNNQAPEIDLVFSKNTLDCNPEALVVDASGTAGNNEYSWTNALNEMISNTFSVEISEAGSYALIINNLTTGCTAMESFEITQDISLPIPATTTPDMLDCNNPSVTVTGSAENGGNNPVYNWYDENGNLIVAANPDLTATAAGNYTLEVVNEETLCRATVEVTISGNLTAPTINIIDPEMLDCSTSEIIISGEGSATGDNITYEWQNSAGEIIGTEQSVEINSSGNYELIITNMDNGCTAREVVTVESNGENIETAVILTEPSDCFESDNAAIIFSEVVGGTAPFSYSIGDDLFSTDNVYLGLSAGIYEVAVEDAFGCRWEADIMVTEPEQLDLVINSNIEPDASLFLGDSLILNVNVSIPNTQIDTLIWDQAEIIRCEDEECYEGVINNLFNSTRFSATLTDTAGCTVTADILIEIEKEREIYIPNSFSPNGDGLNDIFFINGGRGIRQVHSFQIFNRWGKLVYADADFQPNDPAHGWNGQSGNEATNSSVFLYVAEIEFVDGFVKMYGGDVTVVK